MKTILNFTNYAIVALLVAYVIFYHVAKARHTPKLSLTSKEIDMIRKYGLIHFTFRENVEDILREGIKPNPQNALFKREKAMVWCYIAIPELYNQQISEIHKKGFRARYDSCVIIKNLTENDLKNLRYRKKDGAVVHIGILKTNNMKSLILE